MLKLLVPAIHSIAADGLDSQDDAFFEMHSHPRAAEALAEAQALCYELDSRLAV